MSLTFKIAIGVFLGAIAAFLAINAPAWIHQSRVEQWNREARDAVRDLTPDLLIERCGKPDNDALDKGTSTRLMYYKGRNVVLTFWQGKGRPWHFQVMQFGGEIHSANGYSYADGKIIMDAFEQTAMLPCLEEKGAK